ncbi:MAG: ornithine carbamoyltransferase [Candidatus Rokuibacteriota bacterium]
MRHLLSAGDLTRDDVVRVFRVAAELKQQLKTGRHSSALAGRTLALIFEKPSLRTRVTFEVGLIQLGGRGVYLSSGEIGMGSRESVPDVARNLSRWVDGIVARVYAHATVEGLARHANIPVINGLSDLEHPCQAVADFFTLWERGVDFEAVRLAWIGDGNNVCHSLMLLAGLLGCTMVISCPEGHDPDPRILRRAGRSGARIVVTRDPMEAAQAADVLYTDVWISMGQEAEREQRLEAFSRYQLSDPLVAAAKSSALVMHCLPAHRGEEITDAVLDGPRSIVLDQAENRLHAQKAILLELLGGTLDDV